MGILVECVDIGARSRRADDIDTLIPEQDSDHQGVGLSITFAHKFHTFPGADEVMVGEVLHWLSTDIPLNSRYSLAKLRVGSTGPHHFPTDTSLHLEQVLLLCGVKSSLRVDPTW